MFYWGGLLKHTVLLGCVLFIRRENAIMNDLDFFGKKKEKEEGTGREEKDTKAENPFEVFNTLPTAPTLNLFGSLDEEDKKEEGQENKEQGDISLFGILAAKKVDALFEPKNKPAAEGAGGHTSFEQVQEEMSKEVQARVDTSLQGLNTVTPDFRTEKQEEFNKQLQLEQAEAEPIDLFGKQIQLPIAKQMEKESMEIPEAEEQKRTQVQENLRTVEVKEGSQSKKRKPQPEQEISQQPKRESQFAQREKAVQEFNRFNKTTDKVLNPVLSTADNAVNKLQNAALVSHFEKMPRGIVREFEVAWDEQSQEAMIMQCAGSTTSFVMPSKVKGCVVRYVRPNMFKLSKGTLNSLKDRLLFGVKEQFVVEVNSLSLPQCIRKIPNGFLHSECRLKQLVIPATVTTIERRAFVDAQIGIIEFIGKPPVDVQHIYFSPNTYIYCHEQFQQYFAGLHNVYVIKDR